MRPAFVKRRVFEFGVFRGWYAAVNSYTLPFHLCRPWAVGGRALSLATTAARNRRTAWGPSRTTLRAGGPRRGASSGKFAWAAGRLRAVRKAAATAPVATTCLEIKADLSALRAVALGRAVRAVSLRRRARAEPRRRRATRRRRSGSESLKPGGAGTLPFKARRGTGRA